VGNHDHEAHISNAFAAYPQIQPHKHILAGKHWQIVLLDSHIEGKPAGFLADKELQWLEQCLTNFSDRFTLIVLHHNVLSTNADWLDQHSLSNADELLALLQRFPNVKALLHGHIHQAVDDYWYDYRVLATPSTCIQFKPNCEDFTLDVLPQGWREIYLYEDGSIKTECKRLRIDKFLPDFTSKGY
jgi:Icc protein